MTIQEIINNVRNEIKVTTDGKGSITRHGLCMLLGISRNRLYDLQKRQKLAETLADAGFNSSLLGFENGIPDLAVACIVEYYAFDAQKTSETAKKLYRSFAAVGVRAWFQDVTGFTQPSNTVTVPREQLQLAHKSLGDLLAIQDYEEKLPGLSTFNNYAKTRNAKELPGVITIEQYLDSKGIPHTHELKKALGMMAATLYRNLTGNKPEQVRHRHKDAKGHNQSYFIAAYPVDFLPVLDNALDFGMHSIND